MRPVGNFLPEVGGGGQHYAVIAIPKEMCNMMDLD